MGGGEGFEFLIKPSPRPLAKIRKDQLKGKPNPALPMCNEWKGIAKAMIKALEKNGSSVLPSFKMSSDAIKFVRKEDLRTGRMTDKILAEERLLELYKNEAKDASALPKQAAETPRDQAFRTFHKNEASDAAEKVSLGGVVHKAGGREPIERPLRPRRKDPIGFPR